MSSTAGTVELASGDALLVVDVQNDFLPGGALAVPQGDEVIAPLNQYIAQFQSEGFPIIASRDWHPADHCSFRPQGGPWPPHCVAGSRGAELADGLRLPASTWLVDKATQKDRESYSPFDATDLAQKLHESGIHRIFIGGLATDVCVLATVEDALKERFQVLLLSDAIRAIDAQAGAQAIERMRQQGVSTIGHQDMLA